MKILNICTLAFGSIILGVSANPAMGFTLDLFSETDSNTADLYIGGSLFQEDTLYQGQEVRVNQDSSTLTGLLYKSEESDTGLSNVQGGNRHLKIETSSGSKEASLAVGTTSENILNLNTDSKTTSIGTVVWNGSSSIDFNNLNTNAALGLDLESFDPDDDSLGINIEFADQGGSLELTLSDGANTHTDTQSIPIVNNTPPKSIYFDYGTYEAESININSIQYIAAEISGPPASDIDLNFLETAVRPVPFEFSPGLGIVVSGAFIGINVLKKKLKAA